MPLVAEREAHRVWRALVSANPTPSKWTGLVRLDRQHELSGAARPKTQRRAGADIDTTESSIQLKRPPARVARQHATGNVLFVELRRRISREFAPRVAASAPSGVT